MNTEQKAREWFKEIAKFIQPTITELDAAKIITALLAEREALLNALKVIVYEIDWRPAHRAIAMCEESK